MLQINAHYIKFNLILKFCSKKTTYPYLHCKGIMNGVMKAMSPDMSPFIKTKFPKFIA